MTSSGTNLPCVFFGTGPVAAACLELLLRHTTVEAVVTKPRPVHHKGRVPVLEVAEKHQLRVVTVTDKKSVDEALAEQQFTSSYAILIDFGIIISRRAIDMFPRGIINSHFSLLPKLRGADPISWAIANGDKKTGVSLMLVDEGMDTGKLLTSRSVPVSKHETTPELTERLITLSDTLIQEYVPQYLEGTLLPKNQPHPDRATYSRKLTKADSVIDWSKTAHEIDQEIRAFIGWPGSKTMLGSVEVIITKAHVTTVPTPLAKECGKGTFLAVDRLKPVGKKEMPVEAFLAGYKDKI